MQSSSRSCQTHDTLKARARADLKVYTEAVRALERHSGSNFRIAYQKAEHARLAYEEARNKLDAHIAAHGCKG